MPDGMGDEAENGTLADPVAVPEADPNAGRMGSVGCW
jgi:hypothetical protein